MTNSLINNSPKNPSIPYIIGVAGGSGSGKTTFVRALANRLPAEKVSVIPFDWYYRSFTKLSYEERCALNFDHPEALDGELLYQHLVALRGGEKIMTPRYDFSTHSRESKQELFEPTPLILVEGILTFAFPKIRELLDLKIFIYAPDDLRFERRMSRDIKERGRTPESVTQQWQETVAPMHNEFCGPSMAHADLVISGNSNGMLILEPLVARILL